MTTVLAYTFWHQPRPEIDSADYEAGMRRFHQRLAAVPIPGFVDSWTLRVPDLPWLTGGGYEDWYLIEDFGALGSLATHAVDAARTDSHDAMARSVRDGAGGLYALLTGEFDGPASRSGWAGWFTKRPGVSYSRLTAELADSGSKFDAGIRKAVEAFAHIRKILCVVSHMQQDELSLRMTRQYSVPRFQEFRIARKVFSMKRPVGMIVQLFKSLVEPIRRQKECLRIGNMDRNRHFERSARVPHRIEPTVIDLHQRTFRDPLPQVKTKGLQHLKTARSCFLGALNGIALDFSILGTGTLIP